MLLVAALKLTPGSVVWFKSWMLVICLSRISSAVVWVAVGLSETEPVAALRAFTSMFWSTVAPPAASCAAA